MKMKIKILKYYPHNKSKIFEQTFEDAKLRAGSYVYLQNDRIKKICSSIDRRINKIQITELVKEDNLNIYEIILIDPTLQEIINIKKELLDKGKKDFVDRIEQYNVFLNQLEKSYVNLDKLKNKLLKQKENI